MLVKFKSEPPISYWDCNVLVFKATIATTNLKIENCIILAPFPAPFSLFSLIFTLPAFPLTFIASPPLLPHCPPSFAVEILLPSHDTFAWAMLPVHLHSLPWLILSHLSLDFLSMNSWFRKEITLVDPIHLYAPSHPLNRKLGSILIPLLLKIKRKDERFLSGNHLIGIITLELSKARLPIRMSVLWCC